MLNFYVYGLEYSQLFMFYWILIERSKYFLLSFQGKATGNKKAVGFRSVLQRYLFRLGCLIQRRAGVALIVSLILLTACAVGLKERELETRVEKLWVECECSFLYIFNKHVCGGASLM